MQQYRYYNNNFKYSKFLQLSLSLSLSRSHFLSLYFSLTLLVQFIIHENNENS